MVHVWEDGQTAVQLAEQADQGIRGINHLTYNRGALPYGAPDISVGSDGEVPALRTQTSRTYREPNGLNRTVVSSAPVNYRDARGAWQKIDTTLKTATAGAFTASASGTTVVLPASLSAPVTVGSAGQAVSFSLGGAAGTGTASGRGVSDGLCKSF